MRSLRPGESPVVGRLSILYIHTIIFLYTHILRKIQLTEWYSFNYYRWFQSINHFVVKYRNNLINIFEIGNRVAARDILERTQTASAQNGHFFFFGCHVNRRTFRLRTQSFESELSSVMERTAASFSLSLCLSNFASSSLLYMFSHLSSPPFFPLFM